MTTDEIVRALRCISTPELTHLCTGCKYRKRKGCDADEMNKDAIRLIEQLIAENRALRNALPSGPVKHSQKQTLDARVAYLREMAKELNAQREKTEAEKDAALADLADARSCKTCKYACDTRDCSSCKSKTCKCRECHLDKNAWEWRGLPEETEEGEKA